MRTVNIIILIGHINEPRVSTYGIAFGIATNSYRKADSGWEQITQWTRVSVADTHKLFDKVSQLSKGAHLYMEGRLATRSYEQAGEKRWITEVIPSVIRHL